MNYQIDFLKGAIVIDSVAASFTDDTAARDHAVMLIGLRHLRAATSFQISQDGAIVAQSSDA
jgi:hypothetical protein